MYSSLWKSNLKVQTYDWTLRGGGWSWSGLVAGSGLCWLQGGGCDVRDGGCNGSCNASSFS